MLRTMTLGLVLCSCSGGSIASAESPHIVLILADDLGWSDLACYGADLHETPHLDALAGAGARFTQAYAPAPVCTPTRASLLTGKHPARLGITIWSEGSQQGPTNRALLQAESQHDLPHTETTLATHLRAAGYQTALVGKWHLGNADHYPETHGFDVNIGGTRWGAPQTFFWPYAGAGRFGGEFRYVPHLEFGAPGEYLTDRLTDEAIRVLDHFRQMQRPIFLYLAHHAPHTPIEAKPTDVDYFRQRLRPGARHQNATYAAMVRSLDESVGRIASYLKQHDLEDNTLVIFASDNGGYIGTMQDTGPTAGQMIPITTNSPLRSGKGTLYEGGLRVPLIVRWPRTVSAGITCNTPVVLTDLFPTLAAAAGLTLPATVPVDGIDLSPLLHDPKATLARETFYFHYPHYYHAPPSTPVSAVRIGDWKLLEYYEDQHVELYDLSADPGEEHDLASAQPDRVAQLRAQLTRWKQTVGAKLPTPNPDYERVR